MADAGQSDSPAPVELVVSEYGQQDPHRTTIVLLHGLFGSGRNWMSIGRRLALHSHVLAPDLRNHGRSPWAEPMTYPAMAADVGQLITARASGPVTLIGHSMGGKAAMILALRSPGLVRRLVVVDVAPVAYGHSFLSYARAMRAADLRGVTRRSQVEAQLAGTVPDPGVRSFLLQNLVLDRTGARWRMNLEVLERSMGTLSGFPEIPAGISYDGEVLFVAGGRSDYLHPGQQAVVHRLFPRASATVVRNTGHWVHAERPGEFVEIVERFLPRGGR